MSEQIMWVVKGPSDEPEFLGFGESSKCAWLVSVMVFGHSQAALERDGYRCVRVKVSEVGDADPS